MWVFIFPSSPKFLSQILHWNDFLLSWKIEICLLKIGILLNSLSHERQFWGLPLTWIDWTWLSNLYLEIYHNVQMLHLNFFFSWTMSLWFVSWEWHTNFFVQSLHLYLWSNLSWTLRFLSWSKFLPQILHWYDFFLLCRREICLLKR